jgi:hypothetical protein
MAQCRRFGVLTNDAVATNLRVRRLLEVSDSLPTITGLGADAIFDLIRRTLAEKRIACNALASHVELHDCSSVRCIRPAPVCYDCVFLGSGVLR